MEKRLLITIICFAFFFISPVRSLIECYYSKGLDCSSSNVAKRVLCEGTVALLESAFEVGNYEPVNCSTCAKSVVTYSYKENFEFDVVSRECNTENFPIGCNALERADLAAQNPSLYAEIKREEEEEGASTFESIEICSCTTSLCNGAVGMGISSTLLFTSLLLLFGK